MILYLDRYNMLLLSSSIQFDCVVCHTSGTFCIVNTWEDPSYIYVCISYRRLFTVPFFGPMMDIVWPLIVHNSVNYVLWIFLQLDLIKVIASQRSVIAAASVVQRINVVFGDINQATKSPQVGLAAYVYPMFQKVLGTRQVVKLCLAPRHCIRISWQLYFSISRVTAQC